MAKYYAQINGAANVTTNFKPYTVWSNNNYLKLEYNGDITTRTGGICPFFAGQNPFGGTSTVFFTNGEDIATLTISQEGQTSLCPITKLFYNGDRII